MAVRRIIVGEEPVLRTPCEPVTLFDDALSTLLDDLAETMVMAGGIGLSAPQVDVALRVAVVDIGHGLVELVNPVVVSESGLVTGVESCLSFPGVTLRVQRPQRIVITAADRLGEVREWVAEDRFARVILHEMDHLDGVLFFDHVPDEEVLMQLWDQASGMMDFDEPHMADEVELELRGPAADEPWLQDAQLAYDLMAEAAWKLELSLELLSDHGETLTEQALTERVQSLSELSQTLRESVDELESYLEV